MNSAERSVNSFWRRSDSSASVRMSMSQPISCDGEAHVLAAAADGERELLVGHHDFDALGLLVEHDLGDIGRLQRRDHEVGDRCRSTGMMSIFSPCSSATTACTREPRIPTQAPTGSIEQSLRGHGDLGAAARVAGDRADGDDAVVDFRHFLHEQLGHELRMGAARGKSAGRAARGARRRYRRGRGRRSGRVRAGSVRRGG